MRPSLFVRRQLGRDAPLRRSITTSSAKIPQSSLQICEPCSRRIAVREPQTNNQRRWQASSAASPQFASDDVIKPKSIPQTHYEIFPKTLASGPPPKGSFHVDVRELRKEFLQLQSVAHPDRHPPHLKTRAEATSARINEAYKTLQNPLSRAQYLLSLRGIDVAEDEMAKVEDPELLMEVLETREEIESASDEGELDGLKTANDKRIEESEEVLNRAFKEDNMELAKGEAVRMRYWVNIKESLDGWEKGKPIVLVH
ncbi:hypothetical protein QTJ16_006412 [Diplocarpon rosae]|uniref:J domain-containing protein n=1 Tax=Diplocarpon rosae TaxID=946125 RepID=A0AAD9SVW3_9HELO|nr:hypothetical protein QTJ16_006412 [Diplocarpon rosae]PBP28091.1 Fe-S assembly co-chaperone [Diplocarpon rosae]